MGALSSLSLSLKKKKKKDRERERLEEKGFETFVQTTTTSYKALLRFSR
jgi:hypothetical protein